MSEKEKTPNEPKEPQDPKEPDQDGGTYDGEPPAPKDGDPQGPGR